MSVSGISSSNFFALVYAERKQSQAQSQGTQNQSSQNNLQQIESDFSQLGQDLQSGNLTQAQQDFTTLSSALTSSQSASGQAAWGTTAASAGSASSLANSIQQTLTSLANDLQNGNLSAAQQDFGALQQQLQQVPSQGQHHGHHHHGGGNSQQTSAVGQDFNSLAQALQSGDLSGAQTAFASLQQDLQNPGNRSPVNTNSSAANSSVSGTNQTSGTILNVTA